MPVALLVVLAVLWLGMLLFGYSAVGPRAGRGGPSLGAGIGDAIALVIAGACALVAVALVVASYLYDGAVWPAIACATTLVPVVVLELVR